MVSWSDKDRLKVRDMLRVRHTCGAGMKSGSPTESEMI